MWNSNKLLYYPISQQYVLQPALQAVSILRLCYVKVMLNQSSLTAAFQRRHLTGWYFFNDISGRKHRATFTSSCYIHFKSKAKQKKMCLQFWNVTQSAVSCLKKKSQKTRLSLNGFYVHVKYATTMNFMMKCFTFVMTFSNDSVQLSHSIIWDAWTACSNLLSLN